MVSRHCGPALTELYTTQWLLKTRSHLARCSSVLASLSPLQLLAAPEAHEPDGPLALLQAKLLLLATEHAAAAQQPPQPQPPQPQPPQPPPQQALRAQQTAQPQPPPPMTAAPPPVPTPSPPPAPSAPPPRPPPRLALPSGSALLSWAQGQSSARFPRDPRDASGADPPWACDAPRPATNGSSGGARELLDALRALLRLALLRGSLSDALRAVQACLLVAGWGELAAGAGAGASLQRAAAQGEAVGARDLDTSRGVEAPRPTCDALDLVDEIDATCNTLLGAGCVAASVSPTLARFRCHPELGTRPCRATPPRRAAMLASGVVEVDVAAAATLAILGDAAVATLRGVCAVGAGQL